MGNASHPTDDTRPMMAWPVAAPFRSHAFPLAPMIEAEFSGAQLRELARWLGATPKGNSRVGLVEQVVAALNERIARATQSPEVLLDGLTDTQQDFARRLLTARDPELPIARSTAAQLWAKPAEQPTDYRRDGDRHLTELIESLRRRALLFPTRALFPIGSRDVYYQWLPLNGVRVPVVQWNIQAKAGDQEAGTAAASGANFLENFEAFLSAVTRSGVTLRRPLPAHKQAARLAWLRDWEHDADEAERVLRSRPNWAPDPHTGISVPMLSPIARESLATLENQTGLSAMQIEFLFAIACALQLIEAPDPRARTTSSASDMPSVHTRSSAIEGWLVLADHQKLRSAWLAWSEQIMTGLEVRSAMDAVTPEQSFRVMRAIGARHLTPSLLAAEWCALRRYVARVLRGLPPKQWIPWRDLQAKLFEFHPECIWTFNTKMEWWFALATSGARMNLTHPEDWRTTAGVILEHIIRDGLTWFGAVEVSLTPAGRLDAFRITPVGEWLIEARDDELPDGARPRSRAVKPIEWLDDHTLRVPPAPDRAALVDVVRRSAERGPVPFTYTFTAASIERALSDGLAFADIAAQFKRARVSLTKAVSDQFKLIARRHGRVRVYQSLTVLELSDDFAARELAAGTSLMKHVIYQLSPRAFVLQEAGLDELLEELQDKGYTPRVKN